MPYCPPARRLFPRYSRTYEDRGQLWTAGPGTRFRAARFAAGAGPPHRSAAVLAPARPSPLPAPGTTTGRCPARSPLQDPSSTRISGYELRFRPVAAVIGFIDAINRGDVDRPVALMSADHRLQVLRELPVTGREAKPRRVERVDDGVPGLCHLPGSPRALGEPINLANHRIRRKQVLGGLTHEYYVAALPTCAATGKAGHHPNRISEPTDSGADHPS